MRRQVPIGFFTPSVSYPAILDDGNTIAWYQGDNLATITKDGSNFVSRWNDKLASGRDLIQATGTNQPLWVSPNYIQFDGIDNFMKCGAFTFVQPEFIYMIVKQITWVSSDYIFDGNAQNSMALQQYNVTPKICPYAGGTYPYNSDLIIDTWAILRVLFDAAGAGGKIIVDANAPTAGTSGTANAGGFTLGAAGNNSWFGNIAVKEVILRRIIDTAPNETLIYNYLVTRNV